MGLRCLQAYRLSDLIHQGFLVTIELLQGYIYWKSQILVYFRLKTGINPFGEALITPKTKIDNMVGLIDECQILLGHQFSPKTEKKKVKACSCILAYKACTKVLCLWSWAASQAPVTTMVRLGISGCSIESCVVGPTNHLEWVEHSRGNSLPNRKKNRKLYQIELLGRNYNCGMVGGSSGPDG